MQSYRRKKKRALRAKKKKEKLAAKATSPNSGKQTQPQTNKKEKKEIPVYKEYQSASPSLKDLKKQKAPTAETTKEVAKEPEVQLDVENPFTQEELIEKWQAFTVSIKDKLPRIYQVLLSHSPTLTEGNVIKLGLDSSLQSNDFMERAYNPIMKYLKKELNNTKITLEVSVQSAQQKKNVYYSSSDKFNYLADKNDVLNKFKKIFNLELE